MFWAWQFLQSDGRPGGRKTFCSYFERTALLAFLIYSFVEEEEEERRRKKKKEEEEEETNVNLTTL